MEDVEERRIFPDSERQGRTPDEERGRRRGRRKVDKEICQFKLRDRARRKKVERKRLRAERNESSPCSKKITSFS